MLITRDRIYENCQHFALHQSMIFITVAKYGTYLFQRNWLDTRTRIHSHGIGVSKKGVPIKSLFFKKKSGFRLNSVYELIPCTFQGTNLHTDPYTLLKDAAWSKSTFLNLLCNWGITEKL